VPSKEILSAVQKIEALFDQVGEQFDVIERETKLVAEDWEDPETVAAVIDVLDLAKKRLRELYDNYEQAVWPSFRQPLNLPNGVRLESLVSTPRAGWKHKELGKEVAKKIVDSSFDFDTGEMLKSHEDMVTELLRYVGVSYWKLTPLREVGIDPDKYSIPKDEKKSIKITRPKG
jgi:hypothetical protein